MTALPRRRHRRTALALATGLASLALIPVAVTAGYRALRDTKAATNVGAQVRARIPSTPTALLATVDDEGVVTTISVMALMPDGRGGTIVSIPAGAKAETGTAEIRRVADSYAAGGIDALAADLEALVNVSFSVTAAVDETGLEQIFNPVAPIVAQFGGDVVDTVNGADVVVVEKGEHELSAEQAAQVMLARKDGEAELVRAPRINAVWDGVAESVGDGLAGMTPTSDTGPDGTPMDITTFIQSLYSGPISVWPLTADPILNSEDNPGGLDLYETNKAEIVMIMASIAPSNVSAIFPSISFQIDSSFGDSSITQEAVLRLIYQGANVLLVRELDGPVPPRTVLYYSEDVDRKEAALFTELFGPVEYALAVEPVEGIDVQIVLGQDFVDFLAGEPSIPSTTADPEDTVPATEAGG